MSMTMEDYRECVKSDLLEYAREAWTYDNTVTAEEIIENAQTADAVTGNGSGSYTFNTQKAKENLTDLIWDEEVTEMFLEFGYEQIPLAEGPEAVDVLIRCFVVGEFSDEVEGLIDELNGEL
jgi:hypothetical protein